VTAMRIFRPTEEVKRRPTRFIKMTRGWGGETDAPRSASPAGM
jgi:hypothetical protein